MCIDTKRFISEIPAELICPICYGVLCYQNSYEDPNGHVYCLLCIKTWLSKNSSCPMDKSYLNESMLKPVNRLIKGILGNLKISCKYSNIGCTSIVCLEMLKTHEDNCSMRHNSYSECQKCQLIFERLDKFKSHDCLLELKLVIEKFKLENMKQDVLIKHLKTENETIKKELETIKMNGERFTNQVDDHHDDVIII